VVGGHAAGYEQGVGPGPPAFYAEPYLRLRFRQREVGTRTEVSDNECAIPRHVGSLASVRGDGDVVPDYRIRGETGHGVDGLKRNAGSVAAVTAPSANSYGAAVWRPFDRDRIPGTDEVARLPTVPGHDIQPAPAAAVVEDGIREPVAARRPGAGEGITRNGGEWAPFTGIYVDNDWRLIGTGYTVGNEKAGPIG
jgi:hypothetical protein